MIQHKFSKQELLHTNTKYKIQEYAGIQCIIQKKNRKFAGIFESLTKRYKAIQCQKKKDEIKKKFQRVRITTRTTTKKIQGGKDRG